MMNSDDKADWFSWTLFFLTGAIGGALFGFAMLFRRRGFLLPPTLPYLCLFPLACGLVCGGILSLKGDSLFYGEGIRTLPTDQPEHSILSRIVSITVIAVGLILAAVLIFSQ